MASAARGPKPPKPTLPLSAFTSPPPSGTADSFSVSQNTEQLHPAAVIDANVIAYHSEYSLNRWKREIGNGLGKKTTGVVLSLPGANLEEAIQNLKSSDVQIISLSVPFRLEDGKQETPSYIASSPIPISYSTVFNKSTPEGVESLKWALSQGRPIDIDIQAPISDAVLESFEDIIQKATEGLTDIPPIILSNVLPPPHDLELPIVKLMNHPTYLAFQSQVAALSLFPYVSVKFLPPSWDAPTPPTPSVEVAEINDTQQKKEWKRRIKMYLGPVIIAFGYQRILFGSSPCPTSTGSSIARDWYEIARESLVELGVEQETVDGVFYENAKKIYDSSPRSTT